MPTTCPVCREHQGTRELESTGDVREIDCPRCGRFGVSGSLDIELANGIHASRTSDLVGLLRERSEAGSKIVLTTDNLVAFLDAAHRPRSPIEAADRLLIYMAGRTDTFATRVELASTDYPIVYGAGRQDLDYVIAHLTRSGLIELAHPNKGGHRLTPSGWERVSAARSPTAPSDRAFVAMWFHDDLNDAWEHGFSPGLASVGFEPVRVDRVEHNEKICDRIILELRRSALVIADVTGNRGGVYFEAGYAMGMGLPVIWTAKEEGFAPHFDTRQFNHILWSEPADLSTKLSQRILATIGTPGGTVL